MSARGLRTGTRRAARRPLPTPAPRPVPGLPARREDVMGLILAAGRGTRMMPFSERHPKPVLPVAGIPIVAHQLRILANLGIHDVVVVIGHLGHEVVRTLGDGSAYGVRLRYVEQEDHLGIAHAVARAEPYVDRPFFLLLGDIFFETDALGGMIDQLGGAHETAGVLAVKRETDRAAIRRNFVVVRNGDGRVMRVIEKPRHPTTDLKGCGIYLFTPSFFDAVRRTPRTAMRDEYELTDAIQIFINDGYRVEAAEVIQRDFNVSHARDLLELNLYLLDQSGQRNLIGHNVRLHDGVAVERSVLMDNVTVEQPLVLRNCLVFPGVHITERRSLTNTIVTLETEIRCDAQDR